MALSNLFLLKKSNSNRRESLAFFLAFLAGIAIVCGVSLWLSSSANQWTVECIARIKGVPLDREVYGIPRLVLWGRQLREVGMHMSIVGLFLVCCVLFLAGERRLQLIVLRFVAFVAGFAAGFVYGDTVRLPFTNSPGVVGPLTRLALNPLDSTLHYFLLIILPTASVALVDLIGARWGTTYDTVASAFQEPSRDPGSKKGSAVAGILAALLFLLVGGATYSWHSQVPLDTFHEGESLGPAIQLESSQAPYRDVMIIHGAFQDPLRSILGFSLFGRSIASVRTMESLLQIVAHLLFALCVFYILRWNGIHSAVLAAFAGVLLCVKPFEVGFVIPHRDICLFLFLLSIVGLYRTFGSTPGERRNFRAMSFTFLSAFFPVVSFAYSIDRGYFLTIGAMAALLLLSLAYAGRFKTASAIALAAGVIAGVTCIGFAIRWEFPAFFFYVFGAIPAIQDLGWGLPLKLQEPFTLTPIILTALNASWLAHRFVTTTLSVGAWPTGAKEFVKSHFVEVMLLLLSILFFKPALGRSDAQHVHYSSGLVFLLTSVLLVRTIIPGMIRRSSFLARHGAALASILVFAAAVPVCMHIEFDTWYRFPLGARDTDAIPEAYKPAITFLKDSLGENETFLTLTSEGVWYYFLNKPSPTPFPIAIYAMSTSLQQDFVRAIETKRVDYVLYKSSFAPIDGISLEERQPVLARYIQEKYAPFRSFGNQELWRRKDRTPGAGMRY